MGYFWKNKITQLAPVVGPGYEKAPVTDYTIGIDTIDTYGRKNERKALADL